MPLSQSIEGCLEAAIGDAGLPQAALDRDLDRLKPRLEELARGSCRRHPAAAPRAGMAGRHRRGARGLARLSEGAKTLVFFGTGGSSLGGQTLGAARRLGHSRRRGQWPAASRPRTRFYDNLDAAHPGARPCRARPRHHALRHHLEIRQHARDPDPGHRRHRGGARRLGSRAGSRAVPRPDRARGEGKTNGLARPLRGSRRFRRCPHDPNIGGRFSGLTNVGLLPALARGLDVEALREGARTVVEALLAGGEPKDFAPAVGAAVAIGLAKERGIRVSVMWPYSDRLSRFAAWYVQLWGESLGKKGEGTTPVAALGPVDQHSQLQLYLDGAPQHLITVIREACAGSGPRIAPDLARARPCRLPRRSQRRRPGGGPAARHSRGLDRGRAPGPHHRHRAARRAGARRPDDAFHARDHPRRRPSRRRSLRPAGGRIG